uniref:Uncharacterized protein n=1 Tax=Hyaloperonospora arabidopsidis (strain Emoy2) TaxID=559515 RepID=M4BB52_HYAAE
MILPSSVSSDGVAPATTREGAWHTLRTSSAAILKHNKRFQVNAFSRQWAPYHEDHTNSLDPEPLS